MAHELILIVEGNAKSRKLFRDVLTFKGYQIIEAEIWDEGFASRKSDAGPRPDGQNL